MQQESQIQGIGGIYASLSAQSARPRYTLLVLQLVAQAATPRGQAGPFVQTGEGRLPVRDWICMQLMPLSARDSRRNGLKERVRQSVSHRMTGDIAHDDAVIAQAIEDQAIAAGRTNVSRAITDLVRAGLLTRHYAGFVTNHVNRGGARHAVYRLAGEAARLYGRETPEPLHALPPPAQGRLFA